MKTKTNRSILINYFWEHAQFGWRFWSSTIPRPIGIASR